MGDRVVQCSSTRVQKRGSFHPFAIKPLDVFGVREPFWTDNNHQSATFVVRNLGGYIFEFLGHNFLELSVISMLKFE
ncbi:hypothetical protein C1884_19240 [Pseudomonas sp. GW460-R15]|nr:hypothetical protein C1887_28570 [Pseudomonas sp. GW456-R21]POA64925.1 hypothetical protein C1884_19240 [Pseudomonas sp. GW460-R15]